MKSVGLRKDASRYESEILKPLFVSTIVPLVLLEVSTSGSDFVDGLAVSQFLGPHDLAVQGLGSPYYSITGIVAGLLKAVRRVANMLRPLFLNRPALCLEEMVANIIEHGFTSDDKPHSVDIRIVAEGDELILRAPDDCALFNVREKGEMWLENPCGITKNIGIRLTMASAKDLKYMNTLGTNTLLIIV